MLFAFAREQITLGCQVAVVRSPKTSSCSQRMRESSRRRLKHRSSSRRSRSRSSGSSRYSGHYSRSLSLSSCRLVYWETGEQLAPVWSSLINTLYLSIQRIECLQTGSCGFSGANVLMFLIYSSTYSLHTLFYTIGSNTLSSFSIIPDKCRVIKWS